MDIPVVLSERFVGLELFATHVANKITSHIIVLFLTSITLILFR